MPRKYPPTPSASTGPVAEEKLGEMESAFALPPAAYNRSPPLSPVIQRKRTLSGSGKVKEDLPPPPSRARKIIQMKPKEDSNMASSLSSSTKPTSPKRKQPSATSAAGRKIARKTAHSIIERRRRSKMNEEFGVLKDMIPACKGVEMHKLAILQAGIEYVKYLQGCFEKLQDERRPPPVFSRSQIVDDEEDDEMAEDQERETPSASPVPEQSGLDYRRPSTASTATTTTSAHPSPAIKPNMSSSSLSSQRQLPPLISKTYSTSPPPLTAQTPLQTGVSPAFNAIHFNPDLHRTLSQSVHYSPNILPLPKAAMPMAGINLGQPNQEGHAEATATAALMMLTNDRRLTNDVPTTVTTTTRTGGMSVKDLLSH